MELTDTWLFLALEQIDPQIRGAALGIVKMGEQELPKVFAYFAAVVNGLAV